MNIRSAWEQYERHTAKLSEVLRQSALAGVAVAWTLRVGEGASAKMPKALLVAVACYILGLVLDAAQYWFLASEWKRFCEREETRLQGEIPEGPDQIAAILKVEIAPDPVVNEGGIWALRLKTIAFGAGHFALFAQLAGCFF